LLQIFSEKFFFVFTSLSLIDYLPPWLSAPPVPRFRITEPCPRFACGTLSRFSPGSLVPRSPSVSIREESEWFALIIRSNNMNVSEQFERHFNPERFEGSEPRSARIARAPRRTNSESELVAIERRYRRMGFDKREARFKARMYHTMKL
jgi:hypothetical protein